LWLALACLRLAQALGGAAPLMPQKEWKLNV